MIDDRPALLTFIRDYVTPSAGEASRVLAPWQSFEVAAEEVVHPRGKVCSRIYFLADGLLRYHTTDRDGAEVTKFFTEPPYVFTSLRSYNAAAPAGESISAVVPSRGLYLERAEAERLAELPVWNDFVRLLISEVQGFTEDILLEASTRTPEERYRATLESRPDLIRQLPLKHLASYLGVAPQSLSRIRRRIGR